MCSHLRLEQFEARLLILPPQDPPAAAAAAAAAEAEEEAVKHAAGKAHLLHFAQKPRLSELPDAHACPSALPFHAAHARAYVLVRNALKKSPQAPWQAF